MYVYIYIYIYIYSGSKMAKTTCFGIPCGLGATLVTAIFLPPVDPVDPFWHPPVWAATCSLVQHNGLYYRGLGARLGDFKRRNPQKVGVCTCARSAMGIVTKWAIRLQTSDFYGPSPPTPPPPTPTPFLTPPPPRVKLPPPRVPPNIKLVHCHHTLEV